MCLGLVVGATWSYARRLDINQTHLASRNAGPDTREKLDDGKVFAVTAPAANGFHRRCPIITKVPYVFIGSVLNAPIDEIVNPLQLINFGYG